MRSLGKNIDSLNDILTTCKKAPDITVISEFRLNDSNRVNTSLPGYRFIAENSPTNAGGVGMYIEENTNFVRRSDIEFNIDGIETYFIEIPRPKRKNIANGCIYGHPSSQLEHFHNIINDELEYLNRSGFETEIAGDININFLKYATDKKHFKLS